MSFVNERLQKMSMLQMLRAMARGPARATAMQRASYSSSVQIIDTIAEFHDMRRQMPAGTALGLVPTMGGLHEGHLSLVRAAKKRCDVVAVSVFVNPTQFGPTEDFSKYPRTFDADVALLAREGVDYVFAPAADAMYGGHHRCYIVPEGFDDLPEGVCRSGHFRGVATIVTKLFNVVQPTHAFFGQKDAAQCVLMKRLVDDLNMDIEIDVVPVNRESDGLARSTRNQYLSVEERAVASVVYRGLSLAKQHYDNHAGVSVSAQHLRDIIRTAYEREPLVKEIQYVSIGSTQTMEEIDGDVSKSDGAIVSVAVKLGNCRLIDTIAL